MFTPDKVLTAWTANCIWKKFQFAFVQTAFAVYDRCAVVFKSDRLLIVEYPKTDKKKKISIKKDTINISDVEKIRFYQD
jgi:hypothetical protein